jgi:hypothetical protein
MRKVLAMVVLCGLVPAASAVDVFGTDLGVTVDVTFMSKYIWRGFDRFDNKAAWQPSVDFDLGGGFGASVWASYAGSSGAVDATEYNYTVYYGNSIFEDCFKTDYTVGWRYYDFIDRPSKGVVDKVGADLQEVFVETEMPQLVGYGIVPHINYYYLWKAQSGGGVNVPSGSIIALGFDYNFTLQQAPDFPMTFMWDIVYNDGVGYDKTVDNDWSHMLWGLKTEFACPVTGGKITPAVYFQNSFESTVNNEDELFAGISYSLSF